MSWAEHRKKVWDAMEDGSLAVVYAGKPIHTNEDDYYNFEVNSQFYYLTGLEREGMILLLKKTDGKYSETLFIDMANKLAERWTGHMPTKEEVQSVSGISNVAFTAAFQAALDRIMEREIVNTVYFDTFRMSLRDLPDYNLVKANEFGNAYPAVKVADLHKLVCPIRRVKDADEVEDTRKAVAITKKGLEEVMSRLEPGMMEYQVQTVFEGCCRYQGAKKLSFPTIAGSGINGCMMHYGTNHCEVKDGSLILLDLGAKYNNYCSDITRTYPANGKYSPRQREYYELVLKANRAVAEAAKPGMTLEELNDLTKKVLGEGLVKMGKIKSVEEVGKYYMHHVSHSIGIDCHDINQGQAKLEVGWIISDEPGLYVDEEEIGIRIEDDLLITENGCEVLSADIIRDPDEIESFMAAHC